LEHTNPLFIVTNFIEDIRNKEGVYGAMEKMKIFEDIHV
jgi:hypothetical protein